MREKISEKKQIFIIILCWTVYTFAYLGRYSYTSNGVPIKKFYGVDSSDFSLATTFFFFAYGACQIISGILCGKYKMRLIIPLALIISAAINLLVYLGLPFDMIKYLWLINGICQAVLWPSLLRIISCYCDEKHIKFAVIAMSTTVAIGTFISFGTSALFALFDGFKFSFLLASVSMTIVALTVALFYGSLTENKKYENMTVKDIETTNKKTDNSENNKGLYFIFIVFGLYAVAINFIKDGLTTWLPHILSERYVVSDSLSMILTLVLPLFGIFGAMIAVFINNFFKDHSDCTGIFFAISAVSIFCIVFLFKTEYWLVILILFGLVNMFMHGANNVVTSMLPLSVGKKYNAGLVGGILNGTCYVGSTLSQYGIAAIETASGWGVVISMLAFLCLGIFILALSIRLIRSFKRR